VRTTVSPGHGADRTAHSLGALSTARTATASSSCRLAGNGPERCEQQPIDVCMGSTSDSIRENQYRRGMEDADRDVLEFIGDQGKTAEQVSDRFPAFDLERLVRAELVRPRRTNPVKTQSRHAPPTPDPTFYVLTSRGAAAIGLEPHTLHSD
jgi:hypothetical protein